MISAMVPPTAMHTTAPVVICGTETKEKMMLWITSYVFFNRVRAIYKLFKFQPSFYRSELTHSATYIEVASLDLEAIINTYQGTNCIVIMKVEMRYSGT